MKKRLLSLVVLTLALAACGGTTSGAGNYEVYVINADGSGLKKLTDHPADDSGPVWSPDGKQIAFTSSRDGYLEIYVMNADGSDLKNLTNNPADDTSPAWSPDSRQIAFSSGLPRPVD